MGLYRLLAIDGETCQIDLLNGPTNFRSTTVKPFYEQPLEQQTSTADQSRQEETIRHQTEELPEVELIRDQSHDQGQPDSSTNTISPT